MRVKRHLTADTLRSVFLMLLLLQASVAIPHTEWDCRCGELYPHTAMCKCQCPKCVEAPETTTAASCCSGEAMPMCRHDSPGMQDTKQAVHTTHTNHRQHEETGTVLKGLCRCGSSRTHFNLPGDTPFIQNSNLTGMLPGEIPDLLLSSSLLYSDISIPIFPRPG